MGVGLRPFFGISAVSMPSSVPCWASPSGSGSVAPFGPPLPPAPISIVASDATESPGATLMTDTPCAARPVMRIWSMRVRMTMPSLLMTISSMPECTVREATTAPVFGAIW